ncbi:hypothetical protein BD410DRAFT_782054 [Rickenella mellea]|uniref:RING-type domain-containing protein n=1 Tax=Rickenella mellea TaxID=50990 RepID=A0A4Y7QKA8_9AGAM|nr:hypothetical protein BD410DRAFT_782054 [Rickenella mellea]
MENPNDDPRDFQAAADDFEGGNLSLFDLLAGLQDVTHPTGPSTQAGTNRTSDTSATNGDAHHPFGLRFEVGGPGGRRTLIVGGENTLRRDRGGSDTAASEPSRLSEYLRANESGAGSAGSTIPGHIMTQYLLAMLGAGTLGGSRGSPFMPLGMMNGLDGAGPGSGRMGDYVFTQEALDQILSQLMEGANSRRPVPATDDIMKNLPRDILVEGSPLLEKDCAVCKDQFSINPEEPDNAVVVTLPCKHPFHEQCILPWLKSSGTCPVCRHALVPQPDSHDDGPRPGSSERGPHSDRSDQPESGPNSRLSPQALFSSLFGRAGGPGNSGGRTRANSDPSHASGASGAGSGPYVPGGWGDSLD